jgi:predicted nucleic-acid-binding protein
MIGLDTNVLVRWITQDDELQCARIKNLFNEYKAQAETFYINEIVLCETLWVLQSVFSYQKPDLIMMLNSVLNNADLVIENETLIIAALSLYETNRAGFADCLISIKNTHAKCNTTLSFDKAATKLPYVTKL